MHEDSNRVRERRLARGLTQVALARASHTRQSDISLLENSRRRPTLGKAQRIAVALGTTVEDLWPAQHDGEAA